MLIISDSNSNVANDALSAENGSKRIAQDAFFEHSNNEMKKTLNWFFAKFNKIYTFQA